MMYFAFRWGASCKEGTAKGLHFVDIFNGDDNDDSYCGKSMQMKKTPQCVHDMPHSAANR